MARIEKTEDTNEPVVAMGEFKGLRNTVGVASGDPGDMVEAVNVDVDDAGKLRRRDGYTQIAAFPDCHSVWSNGRDVLFVSGSTMYRMNKDYSTESLGTGLAVGAPMVYEEVNGTVFHTNGVQSAAYRGGAVHSWGVANPAKVGVQVSAGALPPGTYQFACTFQRADGFESGASEAVTVTVGADAGIVLMLPSTPNPDVRHVNLYATPPNGDMLYLVAHLPIDTEVYLYGTPRVDEGRPLATQFKLKPIAGTALALHAGRLYVVSGEKVYPTLYLNYELMDLRDFMWFNSAVTVFAPVRDGVFVATEYETVFLRGTSPADFVYERVADYGAVRGTLTYGTENTERGVERTPFWESTEGKVFGMVGGVLVNMTHDRFTYSPGSKGASIVIEQSGIRRFISVMQL